MLAGYDHLLAAAARLQWDAEAIDLGADAAAVRRLDAEPLARLRTLVAGFCLAEHAVADELAPWVAGASGRAAACFAAQARDEARHARFFDRIAGEVLGGRAGPAPPEITRLFADDLPAAARALAGDAARMPEAVGLYHLVLEGIAFAVGQDALRELAVHAGLSGIADGVARIRADERWHVGLGVLHLQRLGVPVTVDAEVARALDAWGPAIATATRVRRVLAAHHRRLGIAVPRAA